MFIAGRTRPTRSLSLGWKQIMPPRHRVFCWGTFRPQSSPGAVQEKERALLTEIISKVNDLFDGELTDDDKLVYVNNVIKGKLLESEVLVQQATNNTKEQFANSPDLANGIMNAIIDAFAAHSVMSKQALDSEKVRSGLKDVLLGPAQLYEALRARADCVSEQISETD
jgi:type I restriction enzyme, R subunit